MKPFISFLTADGWHIGVAIDGKMFSRKVELGQPTASTLANSMDGWYKANGTAWIKGEIEKGYLTELPRDTVLCGTSTTWADYKTRQDEIWKVILKSRLSIKQRLRRRKMQDLDAIIRGQVMKTLKINQKVV